MRPTLASVPLALLIAWFGPSPPGETAPSGSLGLSRAPAVQQPEPTSATERLAEAWESIQQGGFLQATSDVPQRR